MSQVRVIFKTSSCPPYLISKRGRIILHSKNHTNIIIRLLEIKHWYLKPLKIIEVFQLFSDTRYLCKEPRVWLFLQYLPERRLKIKPLFAINDWGGRQLGRSGRTALMVGLRWWFLQNTWLRFRAGSGNKDDEEAIIFYSKERLERYQSLL